MKNKVKHCGGCEDKNSVRYTGKHESGTVEHKETVDAEYYFIQLLFCAGRDLMRKENRELYDVMFKRYETIYKQGKYAQVDLSDINKKFLAIFGI